MRSQPATTSGRRLAALVVCMLLLGGVSVGLDAATGHAATAAPHASAHEQHDGHGHAQRDHRAP